MVFCLFVCLFDLPHNGFIFIFISCWYAFILYLEVQESNFPLPLSVWKRWRNFFIEHVLEAKKLRIIYRQIIHSVSPGIIAYFIMLFINSIPYTLKNTRFEQLNIRSFYIFITCMGSETEKESLCWPRQVHWDNLIQRSIVKQLLYSVLQTFLLTFLSQCILLAESFNYHPSPYPTLPITLSASKSTEII